MVRIARILPIHTTEEAVYRNAFRARRLRDFLALVHGVLRHKPACRVLDVGGEAAYWTGLADIWQGLPIEITLVNLRAEPVPDRRFRSLVGDARRLSELADNSFDVVHSNSVIEHVGGWADMRAMAAEVRRLAPRFFVQTPNFWFPLEPHLRTPFIHWLPRPWQRQMVMQRARGFHPRAETVDRAHEVLADATLLDAASMTALFPDARIVRERFGLITKSLVAVRDCGDAALPVPADGQRSSP